MRTDRLEVTVTAPFLRSLPARPATAALEFADLTIADRHETIVAALSLCIGYGESATLTTRTADDAAAVAAVCLGVQAPAGGDLRIAGLTPSDALSAGRIGALLDEDGLPDGVRVDELLRLVLGAQVTPMPYDRLVARTGLEAAAGEPVERLPRSARRAVQLALALAGDPDVVVLVERGDAPEADAAATALEVARLLAEGRGVLRLIVVPVAGAPA